MSLIRLLERSLSDRLLSKVEMFMKYIIRLGLGLALLGLGFRQSPDEATDA